MIEFANRFERRLQLLIIGEPAAHLGNSLRPQAELARTPARIAHGENRQPMSFAARAFGAALGMVTDGPRQQRSAQDVAGHRQAVEQLLARRLGSLKYHFYK